MNINEQTKKQWDNKYKFPKISSLLKEKERYDNLYLNDTLNQITEFWTPKKSDIYLEIGCGECFLGLELARKYGVTVIGVDYSEQAISQAKILFKKYKIKKYKFLIAQIDKLPIKSNSVNFVYGGGVIEHNSNQVPILKEIFRVLKSTGVSFNTVPKLNIGSLTYRQIWGNIPNIPFIKNIFELIHIKILRSRHMRFGYELSFLPETIKQLHFKSGFKQVIVDDFKVNLVLEYIKNKSLQRALTYLITNTSFLRPMLKVIAIKL